MGVDSALYRNVRQGGRVMTPTKLATQVYVSPTAPVADAITPVERELFWKPRGGLWTSTLDEEGGDWVRWLRDQDYSLDDERWGGKLWRLEPVEANVVVLATPDDYNELAERFPYPDNPLTKLKSMGKIIDWPAVSAVYDAVHVPAPHAYRFSSLLGLRDHEIDAYYAASLFFDTCDAESTCWFRWCFEGAAEEVILDGLASR